MSLFLKNIPRVCFLKEEFKRRLRGLFYPGFKQRDMRYLYGPVLSRRLGLSLGITLTPHKTCPFDCVYCQIGRTTLKTQERKEYLDVGDILDELKGFLGGPGFRDCVPECISLSGFGEPVLNLRLGELIAGIKGLTAIPVVLITNSSLFIQGQVRRDALGSDVIIPSLDAVTQDVFERIDRPLGSIKIDDIINGLIELRKEFKGRILLEIMLVKGVNDSLEYAYKFKESIEKIAPDKVQLNSPVRTIAEGWVRPADRQRLKRIKDILGPKCEII